MQYVCDSKVQDITVGLYYAFRMVLQFIALVLALLTRKVKVKGLDDAKYIAAMVYIICIAILVLAVCYFTIRDRLMNTFVALFSTVIVVTSTFILALVFIPTVSVHVMTS